MLLTVLVNYFFKKIQHQPESMQTHIKVFFNTLIMNYKKKIKKTSPLKLHLKEIYLEIYLNK